MNDSPDEVPPGPRQRPMLSTRLLRATRLGCSLTLALVLLHYAGLLGTPPPVLRDLGFYLATGMAGGAGFALVDWLWRRGRR